MKQWLLRFYINLWLQGVVMPRRKKQVAKEQIQEVKMTEREARVLAFDNDSKRKEKGLEQQFAHDNKPVGFSFFKMTQEQGFKVAKEVVAEKLAIEEANSAPAP